MKIILHKDLCDTNSLLLHFLVSYDSCIFLHSKLHKALKKKKSSVESHAHAHKHTRTYIYINIHNISHLLSHYLIMNFLMITTHNTFWKLPYFPAHKRHRDFFVREKKKRIMYFTFSNLSEENKDCYIPKLATII
jgi:hypothetical protein